MYLTRLSLTNYRIFSRLELDFPRRVVLFTGQNAQGKTSILEAVGYLANFSSFSAANDRQLMNFNTPSEPIMVARLLGEFHREGRQHSIEVRLIQDAAKNAFLKFMVSSTRSHSCPRCQGSSKALLPTGASILMRFFHRWSLDIRAT